MSTPNFSKNFALSPLFEPSHPAVVDPTHTLNRSMCLQLRESLGPFRPHLISPFSRRAQIRFLHIHAWIQMTPPCEGARTDGDDFEHTGTRSCSQTRSVYVRYQSAFPRGDGDSQMTLRAQSCFWRAAQVNTSAVSCSSLMA